MYGKPSNTKNGEERKINKQEYKSKPFSRPSILFDVHVVIAFIFGILEQNDKASPCCFCTEKELIFVLHRERKRESQLFRFYNFKKS